MVEGSRRHLHPMLCHVFGSATWQGWQIPPKKGQVIVNVPALHISPCTSSKPDLYQLQITNPTGRGTSCGCAIAILDSTSGAMLRWSKASTCIDLCIVVHGNRDKRADFNDVICIHCSHMLTCLARSSTLHDGKCSKKMLLHVLHVV